jgi:cell division protein DivIC
MKQKLISAIKGKYGVTFLVFTVWMLFFNDVDLIFIGKSYAELKTMEREIVHLQKENEFTQEALDDISNNAESLEKFAREEYYMKKPNEDIYVVRIKEK